MSQSRGGRIRNDVFSSCHFVDKNQLPYWYRTITCRTVPPKSYYALKKPFLHKTDSSTIDWNFSDNLFLGSLARLVLLYELKIV